jgi:hypothetical protein
MKVLVTEEQYNLYIRRRYPCMRDIIDKFLSGEEKLSIPPGNFKWETYNYILVAIIRQNCGDSNDYYNADLHDEIMRMFGDELYQIFKKYK